MNSLQLSIEVSFHHRNWYYKLPGMLCWNSWFYLPGFATSTIYVKNEKIVYRMATEFGD